MKEKIIQLIKKMFGLEIGIITDIDVGESRCTVRIDETREVICDLFFPSAHSDKETSTIWNHINYPSIGDFALIIFNEGQPYIIQYCDGFRNIENVYDKGKLKINRIKDSDDTDSTLDERLKFGEFILRSLGLGDIFFDKFGNILMDTSKECRIRIGDRDDDHKISNPDVVLKFGKIKDDNGAITTKRLDIQFNHAQIEVLENGTINITSNNTINLGDNAIKNACNNYLVCPFTGLSHVIGTVNVKC